MASIAEHTKIGSAGIAAAEFARQRNAGRTSTGFLTSLGTHVAKIGARSSIWLASVSDAYRQWQQDKARDGAVTEPAYPDSYRGPKYSTWEEALQHDTRTILFVNGMNTTFADHERHKRLLAQRTGRPVVGVYNWPGTPTAYSRHDSVQYIGSLLDVKQPLLDAAGMSSSNAATQTLERLLKLYATTRTPSAPLRVIGHSQGSLIAATALRDVPAARSHVDFEAHGTMLGSVPRGLHGFHAHVHEDDLVARLSRPFVSTIQSPYVWLGTDERTLPRTEVGGTGGHALEGYPLGPEFIPMDRATDAGTLERYLVLAGIPRQRAVIIAQRVIQMREIVRRCRAAAGSIVRFVAARIVERWVAARTRSLRIWLSVRSRVRTLLADTRRRARQALAHALDTGRRLMARARQTVRRLQQWARERIRQAVARAEAAIRRAWDWARNAASNVWAWVRSKTRFLPWDWAGEKVRGIWNAAKSIAERERAFVRSLRRATLDFLRERTHALWEWATTAAADLWHRAVEAAGRAWDFARSLATRLWHTAEAISRRLTEGARSYAERLRQEALDKINACWKSLPPGIRNLVLPGVSMVRRLLGAGREGARTYRRWIGNALGRLWSFAKGPVGRAAKWLRSAAGKAWDFARSLLARGHDVARGVRTIAGRAWDWGRKRLGPLWNIARSSVRRLLQRGLTGARRLAQFGRTVARGILGRLGPGAAHLARQLVRVLGPVVGGPAWVARQLGRWAGERFGRLLRGDPRARRVVRGIRVVSQRLARLAREGPGGMAVRLGRFVGRTFGEMLRSVTSGHGTRSSRAGRIIGRLLRVVSGGFLPEAARWAGTLLGRLVRRAMEQPGILGQWAGRVVGRLLVTARAAAHGLDRATGGMLGRLVSRLAHGAGTAGQFIGNLVGRAAEAVAEGRDRLGQFVGGLVGRLLGTASRTADRTRETTGRMLGRLLGAGLQALRRADSLSGGLLGRALGAGARGARIVGRLVGQLAGHLFGSATQTAQLVGGLARDVLGRLFSRAAKGAGVLGRLAGTVVGRIVVRARERFGAVSGTLGNLAARGIGVLVRGIGTARSVGGELLGRAVGSGMRAVARLRAFIGRGMSIAVRTYRRVLVAQRHLVSPIGQALAGIAARVGRLVTGTAERIGPLARGALRVAGGLARAAGGAIGRLAHRTGDFASRTARRVLATARTLARPLVDAARPVVRTVSALVGSAATRASDIARRAAAPAVAVARRVGSLVGGLASGLLGRATRFLPRIPGGVARPFTGPLTASGAALGRSLGTTAGSLVTIVAHRSTAPPSVTRTIAGAASAVGSFVGRVARGFGLFRDALPGVGGPDQHLDAEAMRRRLIAGGSTGALLHGPTRQTMEQHFGQDFSQVRIHADPTAGTAASAMGARAFTIGSDVFFGPGRYDPHSPRGQELLAHELTHVIQQTSGRTQGLSPFSRQGGDTLEQEAQLSAKHVLARVGRPKGLRVDDYARTYETEDDAEITAADQKRLDTISLMALQMVEQSMLQKGYKLEAEVPSLDVDIELNLGELSDQQAAMIWADAISARLIEEQQRPRIEVPAPAPRLMRAPDKPEPQKPRLTLTEEAKAAIARDVDAITKNVRSWWRKPAQMVEPLRRWYEEDKRLFGALGTPHLDWLIFQMHQRLFDKGTVITRFTSTLDEVERYLADRPEGAAFKFYKSMSQRWKSYTPAKEMEGVVSYIAKREAYAGWMILKGMGTALTGLADVGLWAFWKTSGWPLRKVLQKFGIKDDKLYLTPYIDKKFDESADIIARELGIDANEQLFGKVSLKTFSEAGGKVVGGLMTAGALGQVAKAGQAAQVAGNLEKARKIQLGLQAVNVTQGLQQVEQLHDKIKQLREGPPPLSWSDIVKRPDVWAQVVGIMGTAVGAKMSWSQAKGMISKTAEKIGLALNAAQVALLTGAYAAVDDDPTLSPDEKQKAKAEILSQIVTTGALMADSVWGAKYEAWKQKRAEARQQQAEAARQKKLAAQEQAKALPQGHAKAGAAEAETAALKAAKGDEPEATAKGKPDKKIVEEAAAKEKPLKAAVQHGLDEAKKVGDWDALLQKYGAASKVAKDAHEARSAIIRKICEEHGATATGTKGPASDIDVTFPTERALHKARAEMEKQYGKNWDRMFKASFNSDVMRAHAHLDPRLQLTPEQRTAIEAQLSKTSERLILQRLKEAGSHSDVARAAFKEEAARLGLHKSEVEIPRLTKAEVRTLELQQDNAMRNYEKTLKTLEAARARGNTSPEELAALQAKAIKQSIAITERQMRINQAYPDRYLTPGGVKGTVSAEVLGKFDRRAYAQKQYEALARQQDPRAPADPKELWKEAYRLARQEEKRTAEFRAQFQGLTPHEAYQRALMERLEFVEQIAKAEQAVRQELGIGAKVTTEEVLQRAAARYELSKYAYRAMDTAKKLGIGVPEVLLKTAKDIYKPPESIGGTAAREQQMREVFGIKKGSAESAKLPSEVNSRMVLYASLLDRTQKQIIEKLHGMVQASMGLPDLPFKQSHDVTKLGSKPASLKDQ